VEQISNEAQDLSIRLQEEERNAVEAAKARDEAAARLAAAQVGRDEADVSLVSLSSP